jgi:hypothetical protein
MIQDNIYSYAHFGAIGGWDYEGEDAKSFRLFASYEKAVDYAKNLVDKGQGCDYSYLMGIGADGVSNIEEAFRMVDGEPKQIG